ncbi:TetR/AcrR family transcriptional regulator [Amycolatopsis alba]|uniref:TetR family transcriptional regulator n=1 Tax=Amycolatopsis alba DSM 44262 TaxID=1125972 RepID=A0A229RWZ9_AMYAL|nr:TetR family transcriptional regulator [Amycolatopsis alba]OXM51176.1 TetR family transcriptional regulator [Amycolatopsis alba DSM 44262]
MAQRTREDALSRERIVEAAVELLDAAGERGLTFRTLTERLATGPGAIYWHVANKAELLDAATDSLISDALAVDPTGSPEEEIRVLALGLFEAIARHPWLSTQLAVQLSRSPWGSVTPRIFESIGQRVSALGVPEATWFTATSALAHYIFGAAGQNAANVRVLDGVDRAEFLHAAASAWEDLDSGEFPFMKSIAGQVREHDDREQFLTGIDLILTGITAQGRD